MIKLKKRCPRCNYKMPPELPRCPNCQLNFSKFYEATNKEAKEAIKNGETDSVLMRVGLPSDIKKWKLMLITIFLGFLGGHYYYVGRRKLGLFFTLFFAVGFVNAVIKICFPNMSFNSDMWQVFTVLVLVWGAVIFVWIIDICRVMFNKFGIPVSRSK